MQTFMWENTTEECSNAAILAVYEVLELRDSVVLRDKLDFF